MDVGVLLFRDLDRVCWDVLADPGREERVCAPWTNSVVVANHFVAARKGDVFIKHWYFPPTLPHFSPSSFSR